MKRTGIVRRVDQLGRVVIPSELRKTLGIRPEDPVEILVDNDMIILTRFDVGQVHKECCDRMVANLDGLDLSVRGQVYGKIGEIRGLIKQGEAAHHGNTAGK